MCSIWQPVIRVSFVWLLTPERCSEGGCVCVCVTVRGWRTAWQQQRASFKPVSYDFPTQRKAIVILKKSEVKSLAWYALTTACCTRNTSKYFLSRHICSFWERRLSPARVYSRWLSDRAWRSVSSDQVRAVCSGPARFVVRLSLVSWFYVLMQDGWLWLAVYGDTSSPRIFHWSCSAMPTSLTCAAHLCTRIWSVHLATVPPAACSLSDCLPELIIILNVVPVFVMKTKMRLKTFVWFK